MYERHLKVRQGHRDYFLKANPKGGNPITPFILLKSTWLEEAGFIIDLLISVQVKKRRLIIAPHA